MTTSLDRWEKDPFFAAAEEVQESADRMESAYRTWIHGKQESWGSEQLQRDLHAALGTTKWQLDEFQRAVQSSYDNRLSDETRVRHREFTLAMETQVSKIEKSLNESDDGKGTPRWVRLDEDDRNELALFLTGPPQSETQKKPHGHRRTASATISLPDHDALLQKTCHVRKVPSFSGFLNCMEPNCVRKWKPQGDSDALFLLPIQATSQMNGCFERGIQCEEDCYQKHLHGWYGALQRQLQRSQYQMRYSKALHLALWILLLLFLLGNILLHSTNFFFSANYTASTSDLSCHCSGSRTTCHVEDSYRIRLHKSSR